MRLFLQIDICDWRNREYQKPLVRFAPSLSSDLMATDIDNQSEPMVVDLVIRLIDQADQIFVVIQADQETSIGSCTRLLSHFFTIERKIDSIIFSGENKMVEKMIKPFQEKYRVVQEPAEIKRYIERFALRKD